jgi:hypothetical protein
MAAKAITTQQSAVLRSATSFDMWASPAVCRPPDRSSCDERLSMQLDPRVWPASPAAAAGRSELHMAAELLAALQQQQQLSQLLGTAAVLDATPAPPSEDTAVIDAQIQSLLELKVQVQQHKLEQQAALLQALAAVSQAVPAAPLQQLDGGFAAPCSTNSTYSLAPPAPCDM